MHADSFYRARSPAPPARAPLAGRHEVHTCVVGGGFAGLNTALGLAERGNQDVLLLEASGRRRCTRAPWMRSS